MSFEKKTWYNEGIAPSGVTPPAIDADNLNRIEQGIYDCSVAANRFAQVYVDITRNANNIQEATRNAQTFSCGFTVTGKGIIVPNDVTYVRVSVGFSFYGSMNCYAFVAAKTGTNPNAATDSQNVVSSSGSSYFNTNAAECYMDSGNSVVWRLDSTHRLFVLDVSGGTNNTPTCAWMTVEEIKAPITN